MGHVIPLVLSNEHPHDLTLKGKAWGSGKYQKGGTQPYRKGAGTKKGGMG